MLSKEGRNCNCAILLFIAIYPFTHLEAASFQGLGVFIEDGFSQANAVSSNGKVIVGGASIDDGTMAYKWTQQNGMQILGDLPGGSVFSSAYGLSSDGSYIVGSSSSDKGVEAYFWSNNQMIPLGDLTTSSYYSTAYAISDDGHLIAGRTNAHPYWPNNKALIWNNLQISTYNGYEEGIAFDMTPTGDIVVGRLNGQAFRSINNQIEFIGDLSGGDFYSTATAISDNGLVIVGEGRSILGQEAFRWENGTVSGLGFLPSGSSSHANDTSTNGNTIVGWSMLSDFTAFIWDETNGMRNLKDVLENDYGLNLFGWNLTNATGISSDGTVICGNGINPNGYDEAWIATIPEPSAFLLIGFGVLFIKRGRRVPAL